jgi:tetratricopeptide (TPR) repeat protein
MSNNTDHQKPRRGPNPWLSEQVEVLLSKHTEEELRTRYQEEVKENERLKWETFLCSVALKEAIVREPVLATKRQDMDLPESLIKWLSYNQVEVLVDLVQFPEEWLNGISGLTDEERATLRTYLERMGYPARSTDKPVYLHCLPEYHRAHDEAVWHIEKLTKEAEKALGEGPGDYGSKLDRAKALYEEAVAYARTHDCDLSSYERLVRGYVGFLANHWQFGDDFVKAAEKYILLDIDLTAQVYGPRHITVGEAHRKAGEYYFELEQWSYAAWHYLDSADITRSFRGVCANYMNDLQLAAQCYDQLGDHRMALELLLNVYESCSERPFNNEIYIGGICYDIAREYRALGNERKALEFLDQAE